MTSRLEKTQVHLSSKPPSSSAASNAAAAASIVASAQRNESTPKKFEKHARRSWRRSSAHRPQNASPKGFAVAEPLPPIDVSPIPVALPMDEATHDDVDELKPCRSPSTLSTTSSSGIDSTGSTETSETVPRSHPDSGLGDDCPKLSDSDDVESTHSYPSSATNFCRPPPHPQFLPPQYGLPCPDLLPAVATEEELENIRQFRQQHNYYKNYFARQRLLQQNGPAYFPTHPHPHVPYVFIPYETIDNFLLYLEQLYPQLARSRSTTMSEESCCSTTATIQSRAEAAEPLRSNFEFRSEAFPPLRFPGAVPPMNVAPQPAGPCSTATSRKTSIDSSYANDDVHVAGSPSLTHMTHVPSYSSTVVPPGMPVTPRNDLDYSRIYMAQFTSNPHHSDRRQHFVPRAQRPKFHFPAPVHRNITDRATVPRSTVFAHQKALWFRPLRLGWRHNNDRPFVAYSTEKLFEAQLSRHTARSDSPHPFDDLCSSFDTDPEAESEAEEEERRSISPSVSDRSIFTDDGQLTTVATDVDDHCSVVSSSFADGWVSSHEEAEDEDECDSGRSRTKFYIPLLAESEDAASEESTGSDAEAEKQHVDSDLARLMVNSSYNIPGFTLPMVKSSSKSGSEITISASKSCPSVGGESGYLSCESVSPPPSGETSAAATDPKRAEAPVAASPLPPPADLFHDGQFEVSKMDVLSEQIWYFHKDITQSEATLSRKMALRSHLNSIVRTAFPMSGLYVVGSSLNGFGNNSSDMDLCLMITNKDLDQRTDAVVVLNHVMNCLSNCDLIRDNGLKLIIAKVPILRIKFNAPYEDITVDLNANNAVAIKNTHLLCHYSAFDWRVRPLVSVIKEWAKRRGMNDANKSSFTSYSLVLMVVHYLQCGLDKPILPSLQKMYNKRFNEKNDVRTLEMAKPFEPPSSEEWEYDYSASLCDLLLGFLRYYAFEFDFNHDAISVRLGQRTDRAFVAKNSSPLSLSQWRCICIEEPFTLSNTAHSIYDEVIFDAIKGAFKSGFEELDMNRDLDAFLNMSPIKIPMANARIQQYGNFLVEANYTTSDSVEKEVPQDDGSEADENEEDSEAFSQSADSSDAVDSSRIVQKRTLKKNRKGTRGSGRK